MEADAVFSAAAVLTSVAETVDGFAAALRAGRSGVRTARLPGPARVTVTAPVDEEQGRTAGPGTGAAGGARLRAVTGRCSFPTRAAARVGWEAALAAKLSGGQLTRTAVVVGGNNLALEYQARAAARICAAASPVLPSHALAHLDTDIVGAVSELTGATAEGYTIGGASASGTLALI